MATNCMRRSMPRIFNATAHGKRDSQARHAASSPRVYLRFYPLFQQAYQDLGYPNGYFNDRLVKVIDVLLATPQIAGPIELVRPKVMYAFADPTLESAAGRSTIADPPWAG